MHLRDQQQFRTFTLQLYEKGLLSAQTVLEAFDFDPDQEIERKRYDAIQMAALGIQGGQGGAGGDMGGGFGGGGGGGMPSIPGGDAGGAPDGGAPDMGGAPISAPGAGAAPAMATTKNSITTLSQTNVANPSNYGGKILKQKTRQRLDSEKQKVYKQKQDVAENKPMSGMRDAKGRIVFTKCERQLLDHLNQYKSNGLIRYPIVPQFEVKFGSITYPLDFAFPHLKIAIEADGEAFHSSPKQVAHDKERDARLAQLGWTVLRFTDSEIEDRAERVMSAVVKTIMQKEANLDQQKTPLK
jgi:very-short-patch-repair endonuclease